MKGTLSKLYIHIVFGVKRRQNLISESWEVELYKYITGIITNKGQKLIAINGMPDHLHILIGLKPNCCVSDLIREVKKSSNEFIKERGYTSVPFQWQEGFGTFSHEEFSINRVINYIKNQKAHHRKENFKDEFVRILKEFNVDYEERYLFDQD